MCQWPCDRSKGSPIQCRCPWNCDGQAWGHCVKYREEEPGSTCVWLREEFQPWAFVAWLDYFGRMSLNPSEKEEVAEKAWGCVRVTHRAVDDVWQEQTWMCGPWECRKRPQSWTPAKDSWNEDRTWYFGLQQEERLETEINLSVRRALSSSRLERVRGPKIMKTKSQEAFTQARHHDALCTDVWEDWKNPIGFAYCMAERVKKSEEGWEMPS